MHINLRYLFRLDRLVMNELHICYSGPTYEEKLRKRKHKKWCFRCRKKLPHMLTALIEKKPSYYDPTIFWKCDGCLKDFTRFWGT